MKVLITRTDRLGDTILASPTWLALKDVRPEAEITLVARGPFLPLFENDPSLAEVVAFPLNDREGLDRLSQRLSSGKFDLLLALYVDRDVVRLVRGTAVPLKAGPVSKPRTWFLFNRPLRQNRSRSLLHEADYNGLLLERLGLPYYPRPPRIYLSEEQQAGEEALLARLGGLGANPFVVIHPGMGGSAGNWPALKYALLVDRLLEERKETVVVTGTETDRPYLGDLPTRRHPRFISAVGEVDLQELALLLRRAALFVGPSTGPMHLATALDTPVVTVFSPVQVQQPRRWGPYHSRGTVLIPPVECAEKYRCRKERCRDYNCMDRITVDEVSEAISTWLDDSQRKEPRE